MAEKCATKKCIVCGGETNDGMVVCYRCFFNYDFQTYNRKELEKQAGHSHKHRESSREKPTPVHPPQHGPRVINQHEKSLYDIHERYDLYEYEERAKTSPPGGPPPPESPRDLPTLASRINARKRPKTLFSSFSWLLDAARS